MEYKKPQATIIQGNVGIYPLTTADQVILADGTRLEKDGKINVDVANSADSAKLGGKAPEYYIQPRNLLDNSDFRNPVNQRGQTSYEIVGGFYNIDRWVGWLETSDITSHIIVQDGYITVETGGKLQQKLASYKQNTIYTAAAKRTDGTVSIVSGMFSNAEIGGDIFIKTGSDGMANVGLRSGDYLWIALYEGSYTADTLPPYVPKGYAAELAECMRYYYQSWTDSSPNTFNGAIIREAIALSRATNVVFPQTMRISNPTVTLYSPSTGNTGKASEFISDTEIDASSVYLSRNGFTLSSVANAFEIGKHYCIHYSVSADL